MRTIDADDLVKQIDEFPTMPSFLDILEMIKEAPTIDIVNCINCRRCSERGGHANCNGYLYCRKWKTSVDESCFCSWGERK